jgi:hypothetical protein|tara:strand:- start:551 stop:769 length:219 start_codon:yes stop_codon:yes gene_type:complete
MYADYQRLKDLDDKESKVVVSQVMDFLESASGSSNMDDLSSELMMPKMLLEDTIELLILKGWLILPNEDVKE